MTRIWNGTASVTNGDATVVLTGEPLTDANCPADATIVLAGVTYYVLSRTNTTTVELTRNYAGSTSGSVVAEIDPLNPEALSVVNLAVLAARVQAQLNILDKNSQGLFYNGIGVTGATDPGPGNLAFDDADPTLVEAIYVDNIDANNLDVAGVIDLWTAGTILIIRSLSSTAYRAYRLPSGVTDSTGFRTAITEYVDHDGVLADEPLSVSYSRVGEGLEIDAAGVYPGRSAYDAAASGFVYLSTNGAAGGGAPAVLYIKNSATSGDWSAAVAFQGPSGDKGWAPDFNVANDGSRRVLQLVGYVGGTGTEPTDNVGLYLGGSGYTATIGSAMNFRGEAGATGATGAAGTDGADGADGIDGTDGADGVDGTNGTDGADGTDPGILLIWDEDNADSDQGAGKIWADNDGLGAATTIYVSKTNRAGDDIEDFLLSLDSVDSTIKGGVTLTRSGGNAQTTYDLLSVTDATGYVKLEISTWSGASGFLANDLISFQFSRAGNKGTDGLGAGDFVGPASSASNNIVAFDGTTGKLGKDSGIAYTAVALKANNGSDFTDKHAAFDNLSIKGADIASTTTVNLDTATGSLVHITGTNTTTAFTLTSGRRRRLIADAAWVITAGTNLVINGIASASNYTCAAGDVIDIWQDGTTSRLTVHKIGGKAVVPPAWSEVTSKPTTLSGAGITDAQPLDSDLTAIAALTSAANKVPYSTGSGTWALADFPASARTAFTAGFSTDALALLDDANFAAMRTSLGLAIGTNVQAYDADLATIAGLTATTDNFIVSVSSAWASRTPAQVRTTLGLVVGTDVQAYNALLAALAGLTGANGSFIRFTGASAATMQAINGTVSQSGGVATGALFESGSNANGTYQRTAGGFQWCGLREWQTGLNPTTTAGSVFSLSLGSWTYPATFSAGGFAKVHPKRTSGNNIAWEAQGAGGGDGTTISQVLYLGASANTWTGLVHVSATGEWF